MKGIHIVYEDENLLEYFGRQETNLLDGRTPVYLLAVPEYAAIAVAEDAVTIEEALEAAEEQEKEDAEEADIKD